MWIYNETMKYYGKQSEALVHEGVGVYSVLACTSKTVCYFQKAC
jgi:hypothetical protein